MSDAPTRPTGSDAHSDRESGTGGEFPATVGQYRLEQPLGSGGMGTVYKALHLRLKKVVALKLLSLPSHPGSSLVKRFHQEMEAIGRLEHPNIVRATDAGEDQGRHFLVMEFVEGQDLGRILKKRGPLPVAEACGVIHQAAQGLQYLAERRLVHRDIKPSNMLLTPAGEVKILDLGLALFREEAVTEDTELTQAGQIMGTWDFMAPEQTLDSHEVDIRADIYSLGCTFYKLLTGQVPFPPPVYRTQRDKARAHRETPVPPVRSLRPEVPEELQALLDGMLAKNPEDRFAEPRLVAQAVERFAASRDLSGLLLGSTEKSGEGTRSGSSTATIASAQLRSRVGWRNTRRALFAAGALGLAIWAFRILLDADPSPSTGTPHPQPPVVEKLPPPAPVPGRWFGVMGAAPTRLHWSKNIPPPVWNEGRNEILAAPSGDLGVLGLEKIPPGVDYRFRVTLRQNPWSGGCGLIFGFRDSADDKKPGKQYHTVGLNLLREGVYRIERRFVRLFRTPKGLLLSKSELLAVEEIPAPTAAEETLEVEVHRHVLVGVRWAGRELPGLCGPFPDFTEDDFVGWVGTVNVDNMAIFRDAQIMHLERTKP